MPKTAELHNYPRLSAVLPGRAKIRVREALAIAAELLIIIDVLAVVVAGITCAMVYNYIADSAELHERLPSLARISMIGGISAGLLLRDTRLASDIRSIARWDPGDEAMKRTIPRFVLVVSFLLALGFLTRAIDQVPRSWATAWGVGAFLLVLLSHKAFGHGVRALQTSGTLRERVAVVGPGSMAAYLSSYMSRRDTFVDFVGTFSEPSGNMNCPDHSEFNDFDRLIELGRRHRIDRVILTSFPKTAEQLPELLGRLKSLDAEIDFCPDVANLASDAKARIVEFAGLPIVTLACRPIDGWGHILKLVEDLTIGSLLLLLTLPLAAVIGLAIKLESPTDPVLFRQRRHGCNNTEFEVLKFRTMINSGCMDGSIQTCRGDKRITPVGRFLRKSSLDELPQLLNVLRGDMSLVGPRPHPVDMRTQDRLCCEIVADYAHRHRVKPGITGWAQIHGLRGATNREQDLQKRVEYDLYYIENWSILLDLRILLLTPFRLIVDRNRAF